MTSKCKGKYKECPRCSTNCWYIRVQPHRKYKTKSGVKECVSIHHTCVECNRKRTKKNWNAFPHYRERHNIYLTETRKRDKINAELSLERMLEFRLKYNRCHGNRTKFNPITFERALSLLNQQKKCCVLTGVPLSNKFGDLSCLSLDRIDSNKPYSNTNVQLTTIFSNLAKSKTDNAKILEAFNRVKYNNENLEFKNLRLSTCIYLKHRHAKKANNHKRKRLLRELKKKKELNLIDDTEYNKTEKSITQKTKFTINSRVLIKLWKKQQGLCNLTGIKMALNNDPVYGMSIDRINSSKGYINGNVQLLCLFINYGKREANNQDAIEMIEKIRNVN
jgi:hypothetical protein